MRISTFQFHNRALDGLLTQQVALSKTQNQIATGKRVITPSDDPINAVHILELQRAKAEADQFTRNSEAVSARLSFEERSLGDATVLLQRVRELVTQANSGVVDTIGRNAIAAELSVRVQELIDLANRRDGNGEYLFSGYATTIQPFARNGSVVYFGDQGHRAVQIGPTQFVNDGHSGHEVFQDIRQGNGTFVTGVDSANTGAAVIDAGSVINPGAWVPDTYTLTFTSPTSYEVRNSANALIVSGTYASGNAIAFNGVQVTLTGTPATGDRFTVATSQREDVFTTIDKLVTALRQTNDTQASRAQFASNANIALAQLDRAEEHLLNIRAEVGARLSLLDSTRAAREDFSVDVQRSLSQLQDVDLVEAISRMNRQYLGLQAAQQSYANIAQLSLFNYL